ncbi:MBL fold metallo-hydrolase [Zoogloea sp.]|uniref:MBL fold metallo-hydrolase n=1 Tax=Zoogloea sp. TaxID=49181 RepID=UPI002632E50B|nr:MBL fold metallo-hydrolase [Zoogloea sp.]MDD3353739.1 MBL fold metallo-hydrolase [Zoogloea sp.]
MTSQQIDYPFATRPEPGQTLEVAPGVHWIRMGLPFALDHINLWLIEDGDGLVIVDTGYGLDATREAWETILARFARPITRILVTHYHPDHLGLAQWLSEKTGAPVWMSNGEFLSGHAVWHGLAGYNVVSMVEQFRHNGLDQTRCAAFETRGNAYAKGVPALPATYRRIYDGERLEIGGRQWQVLIGRGHSPEHAALWCEEAGVLISGDMLLPRISTNVSVFAATPEDDPLGCFLDSISDFKRLPATTLVLPSHGSPFRNIGFRVDQLMEHHAARCAELLDACSEARSAGELLPVLFPRPLDTHQVMFAMGEAIAHLNHLERKREVRRRVDSDGVVRFIKCH